MRKIKNIFINFVWAALFAAGTAGPALAQFTGDFSQPGGAVYDGGSSDRVKKVVIDTHTAGGGPFLYVVGSSSQGAGGNDWAVIKYNMMGVKLASAAVSTPAMDYAGGAAVDQAGNLFVSGQAFGAGRIMKYDPALNLISSATVASANIGAIAVGYSGGVEYVYALVYTISGVALHRYTGDLSSSVSMVVRNFSGYFDASESIAVQDGTPASIFVGLGLREGTIPMNATPLFVTYKYSDSLILQASTTFSGGVRNQSSGMALDPVTNDLYVLGTSSSGPVAYGVLLKYSTADLTIKSSTTLPGAWAFGAVAVDVNTHTPYASFFANTYRLDSALTVQAVYTGLSGDSMAVLSSSDVFVTGTSSDNIVTRRINLTTSGGAPGGGLGGGVDGSKQFQMVPDGAGGAYLVYDSTVAEDGLRRIFAVRRGADNSPLWGPVAVSTAYYAGESSDIFAGSDGAGGVIAAWFEGNGIAYAQRYIPDGTAQWDPGGRQISSSAVLGGEFHENSEGGFFALLGYPTPTGMTVVVQKVNNYGICMWPTAGNCVTGSAGTVIPTGDFNGNARGVDAGSGSLLFAWPGDNGGRLALFGSKVAADGTLAWNKKVLAQSSGDEGATVEGMNDGAGGVYLVWTSSAGGAQALYAGRFDSAGDAYPTWSQALRLTDSYAGSSYGMKLAKDEDGFAVMYSTGGNNGNTIRIIRSSAAAGEIANGWVLNGKSVGVGNFGWTSTNLIYSSSAYHFVWSTWEPPAYKVYYQKTDKAGNYAYAGGSMVGNFRAPVNAAIAPDGTGGALAGWKMSIGGDDLPGLKRMLPATTENGFTGAFSESTGVNFDGGDMDAGFAAALYGANVYVAGMTVPAGAIVIKYDLAGNMVSSATLSGLESFDGVAVNDNGVYAAGKGSNGFVTAKYDHSLVLSSAAVLPGETHARDLALDNFGNVYVIGSNAGEPGGQNDYKIVKYNADLTQLGAPVLFDAGGVDGGKGIAYDDGYIYVTGDSLQSGTTYFVTAKFTSSAMVLVSSIVYTGPVSVDANSPVGEKLAVNPVTHDVYFTGNSAKDTILALKYDRDLAAQLGVAHFSSPAGYAQGTGIALDAEGNVNVAGSYNSGAQDYAVLLKYDPGLVFLSSAASVQPYGYDSMGVALATATGYAYMTGLYASDGNWENPAKFDMRTVRFAPLGGQPAPQPFTGSFSAPGGAVYDGGDMDGGFGAAFYGSNVYAAGVSAPSGAVVLKYDLEGTIVSSAVMAGLESFNAVVVNTDGVYAAGRSAGGFVTAKYSHDLVLSSAAVLPGESNARDLTLDTDGNVYVVGANDVQTGYKFVKYDRDLNQLGLPVAFNAGGTSSGKGIAVDNGNIYITGDSLIGQTTYFITARYNSSMMFLSSVAYVSDYAGADNPGGEKLAVDPVTHEVYFAGSYGTPTDELDGNILTIKYSPDLVQLSTAVFSHFYAEGGDIALDNEGNVYTLGINQDVGSGNYAVVLKYSPSLVLLSSATQRFTTGYVPASIAVDTVTLNSYVTGIDFGADKEPSSYNMRTVRFAPLGGTALPTVFLSTRDASPEYFMSGEEAAALSLTPYTDSGETVFSSMTVALNPGGNTCNIRAAALYYDTDHNDVWNAGDRLVSSAALNCSANVTFVSNETIGTQKTAYFITVTPAGGDNLKVAVYSRASFKFGAAMADQPVYPIVSAPKGFGQGSSMFKMVSDGAGGAYMVYDSTVAEGGLRQVFVERVGADNASLWGPTPITPYYHSVKDSGELFAAADGSGGVIAAWFDGDSVARAQRYNASGAQLWGAGGLQISSGVTQGGEFTANAQGGLFALFGYPSAAGMAVAVQKIDNDGQCQWPAPGDCVNVATGTALSVGDSVGEGRGIDGGSGSLIFVWAGGNGGRTALFGSKIAADGMLAWSKTLSAPTSSDEGGTVEGISDGLNGAYVLWTSSTGGAQALFAERFDVNGDPYPGWNSALRLSSYVNTLGENRYEISLARDEDGFAVLYSTGGKGRTEVRIVRSSATAAEFAAGWALDGKLAGQAVDDTLALIYDGSAYHFAWNQWAQLSVGNSHQIDYQKMDKDGKFSFTNGYVAGMAPDCLRIDIVSDGAGGALTAWKTKTGGLDLPVLRSIPAGTSVPEYTGTIAGNIYYEGQQEGLFHIAISTIAGDIYPEDLTYSSRTLVAPGGYSFTELLTPNTYYIQAWLGSGGHGAGQPGGAYNSLSVGGGKFMSEPLYLPAGAAAESVNITLRDFGQVSGTILAPQNGPVLLVAAPFEPGNPYNEVTLPSTGAYTTWIASSSVGYSLKAWIDANENHDLDGGEYYGERSLAVNSELLEQSGIDLELAPYSTSAFSGNFSQPGGAVYNGGDSDMGFGTAFYGSNVYVAGLSAPGGAVVVKYDLEGTFVSSSALEGAESFDAVAVNANGVYLAGKGPAGFVTAKYSHDLVLSSAAVLPGENHARDLALDAEGNVYVIGSDAGDPVNNNDYKFVKYDADLNQVGLPVTFDAGGVDSGSGIAADGGDIYVTGTSLIDGATSFVTARYDSALAFLSSAAYTDAYYNSYLPGSGKLTVNPATHDVYLAATRGGEDNRQMLTVRYSRDLLQLGTAVFPGGNYGLGMDVALDADGYVYALGKDYDGAYDNALVAKYTPALVFLSSAASAPAGRGYLGTGIALDNATGTSYVTGMSDDKLRPADIRTVRFAPLGGFSPPVVYLSTRDVSPMYYMKGEEAAALSITPRTDQGETTFSGMAVRVNTGGDSCSIRVIALYYDQNQNSTWDAGDRLVSSSTLDCGVTDQTFAFPDEAVSTRTAAYFVAVTPNGGTIGLEVLSHYAFTFGAGMAEQSIYPIAPAMKGSLDGSSGFRMVSDGAGGAYMVYDSTVAAGGLRQMFVERVGADNTPLWGPTPVIPAYYPIKDNGELFAASDGSGGVIAAWFDGSGAARAQRYNASGAYLWGTGGRQISSGTVEGGEFTANAQGGFFALFGYPSAAGMAVAVQKIDNNGQCQWPAPGDCVNVATGTALPVGESIGEGRGIDGGSGSLIFVWAGGNGGRTALFGSRIAADGTLAWNNKALSAPTSSDEGGNVEGISDGLNGAYVVWTSSTGGAQALFAERFNVNGDPYPGWNSALRLSSYINPSDYNISVARDEYGFAVLYSTGWNGQSEVRIVRSSATAAEFAAGWAQDGNLVGRTQDNTQGLVYDGSAYHFAWNQWVAFKGGNSHQISYQKMYKNGAVAYPDGYTAGEAPGCLNIDIVSDGAGGALAGWKTKTGGADVPELKAIPADNNVPEYSGAIQGNIYYEGTKQGAFHIAISTIANDIYPESLTYSSQTLGTPGGYSFSSLPAPNTYYIQAWLGEGGHSAGMPGGAYNSLAAGGGKFVSAPLYLAAGVTAENINITLRDFGLVSGTILAPQNGPVLLTAAPVEPGYPYNEAMLPSTGAYTTYIASSSVDYTLKAWIDANDNYKLDQGEFYGERPLTVNSGLPEQSGIDMALSPYSSVIFTGNFSETGGAVYDGGSNDAPHRLAVDTAALNGPFIYGAGTSSFGDDEAFIVKYDKYGVMAASAAFNVSGHPGEANGIAVGADSIFVAGNYDGTAHDGKCLILKYSKDLLLQSSATYSSYGYCIANDVAVNRSGGVYVTGHVNPSDESRDLVILKYDDNLHFATSVAISGSYDKGMEIRTDETGNVYAVGYSSVAGSFQILTLKYDPELVFISSAVFSSNQTTDENRVSLSLGQTGVYVAGQTGGTYSHGTLLKYDRDLVLRSSAAFDAGTDSGWQGVGVNSAGEVFAAGNVHNGNDRDFLTAKYTPDLVFVSSMVYDNGHEDAATDIALDGSDNLYVGGFTSNGKNEDWRIVRYAPSAFGSGPSGPVFSGDFSVPEGANFDGGYMDMGLGAAVYGSNVYAVGLSSSIGAIVIKYDLDGIMVSSAALAGAESFDGVAVNANGVYLAGKGPAGFVTAKYSHDLVLSSAAVLPGENHAMDLALDTAGNVYVVGSNTGEPGSQNDYKFVKYTSDLAQQGSPVVFNAGGADSGRGIAVDDGNVYITGDSLIAGTSYFVTARFNSSSMAFLSSAAYTGAYPSGMSLGSEKLGVNANTHEVYFAGTSGTKGDSSILTLRYSADLQQLSAAASPRADATGMDIALDDDGNVYTLGNLFDGLNYASLAKYNPALVLLSSATVRFDTSYAPVSVAVDTATGRSYVTGIDFGAGVGDKDSPKWNMRTVRFDPLGGSMPIVRVSTRDVSPELYLAGKETAALELTVRTVSGETTISAIRVHVNPNGDYGKIAAVGLYSDANGDGLWNTSDTLISSAAVDAAAVTLPITEGMISPTGGGCFVTLTPYFSAAGASVNVAIDSTASFIVGGLMDEQAIYPITSAPRPVQAIAGAFSGDFSQAGGAVYSGPDYDLGTAIARNPANGDVYVTAVSSVAGREQALLVKYNSSGVMTASATVVNAGGMYLQSVAVNANGVYAAGGVADANNSVALKYDLSLRFVSSATITGVHSPMLALDAAGGVYLSGTADNSLEYILARFAPNLTGPSTAAFSAGTGAFAAGMAADSGSVYMTGTSLLAGATNFVTVRFNAATLAFVSSASYSGAYVEENLKWARLAVNPATHDVYLAGTEGTEEARHILTVRYSQNLRQLASASFPGGNYQLGFDVALDSAGYVYTVGKDNDGGSLLPAPRNGRNFGPGRGGNVDRPALLKYSPNLVFISSAAGSPEITGNYLPFALALDTATGYSYVTGGGLDPESDMHTVRFAPMSGLLPVVSVSTADVSPAYYLAGQEAAALRLTLRTNTGATDIRGLKVGINPSGSYFDIASVGLYLDSNANGVWDPEDFLVSSAAVAAAFVDLPVTDGIIDTNPLDTFVTLTPALAGEGHNVNVVVPSSAAFDITGDMAQQAIYPVAPAPKLVKFLARLTDLSSEPGANLRHVNLSWTYPQDISFGHYVIRYSTNPADLASPNVYDAQTVTGTISGVTAEEKWSHNITGLEPVTVNARLFPYYFAAWLFNGASTSAVSNPAASMYFPETEVKDRDAALRTSASMSVRLESRARYARSSAGMYSAVSFESNGDSFIALNAPGGYWLYYDSMTPMALRDLAADGAGNAYALVQKEYSAQVVKIGADGSVLNVFSTVSSETAKALAFGAGAVYAATEYAGETGGGIRLRKLDASSLALAASLDVSSGPGLYDEVNGLAFTMDASGRKYIYAAGASGSYPQAGTLRKFADTGAAISTAVAGNWPVQYSNPGGGNSRALAVKADMNGNLVVTGSEQRYDLNQGENIWLSRYTPYGAAMFSSPARYNNAQSNSDDIPAGLDLDNFGNIYVSGYTDMWNLRQGYNMLLVKFGPGGQFLFARVYDSGSDSHDAGLDVFVSSDNYAHVSGMFAGAFGVYSMPQGSSASAQFFTAAEGPYTGSADLMWNYPAALPAGSTYYVQYSTASAPVWSSASAQIVVSTGPLYPGAVQTQTVGGLPVLRYPGQEGTETRGNLYKFKVWITSGGLTTALPETQTFAKTPNAYDNTQDFGRERLSFMSGLYGPDGGIAVDGAYVYHAFGGYADGASAGFGLRKYNTGQYLEWTKFFNHKDDRAYYVAKVVRDAAGNFYLVGSQRPAGNNAAAAGYEYSAADKDLWIAKLNAAGDLVWSYSADASGLNRMDELYGAAVEGSALYVVGVASSASAGMDILARKYDISPSTYPALLWTYSKNGSGGGDDFGYGIAVGTGAVYLTGTVDNGAANKDIIVQGLNKTSALAGAPIVFNSAGNGNDTGYGLAVTTTGFVYVAGSTASVGAAGNAALFKFTLGGALVWDRYYNGKDNLDDAAYALELTTSGVIAAGYETSSGQGRVSSYRKFTLAGDLEWSRGLNLSAGDDYASALTVDASGRVYSAVSLDGRPGFYYFPEPDFNVLAAPYGVPGSVRLEWLSQYDVPAGSVFSVQYSTYSGGWNSSGAQVRYAADADIREGMSVARVVYGLESVPQYFKVWVSTSAGTFTPVGVRVALARPVEGSVFAAMSMYPNEAKLFVTGGGQRYNYGEKEFPGAARDASGNLYMVADTDWNGSGGLVIKKFNSAFSPLWTKYYAPGESSAVRANRMAADADGYLYLTGYERGPAAADGKDLFVMKFGANGLVWKTVYDFAHGDDTGYGVALDASGNVYAAGSVYTGSAQGDNIFLVKLSTAGVILSSANFDGSGSGPDAAYGIAVRGTDLYLAGSAYQSVNGRQLWTGHFRTSDLGQLGTAITGGAAAGAGYDVAVDSSGYVYAAGELHSADTANDAIVIKSSADLSAADWAFPVLYNSPGNANDAAYGIELDTTGSVYVTGSQERYDINQDKNLWIRKYSRSGSELWSQEFYTSAIAGDANSTIANSDEGFDLAVGTMGFVSVSGKFNGYYGLYRYKQSSALTINPVLTVKVSSAAASAPFPGVGVSLVPYSQTGGIDASGIRRGVTDSAGIFAAQVPAGKQYFIALDKQGFAPGIVAQQMDPYGSYFVQLNADATKQYILSPRPAASPYYPLTVTVTSATAGDYVMAEVFFAQTGERAAYGIAQVAVGAGSVTFTVSNVPPAVPGAYTLGVTIPNRSLARGVPMNAAFPAVSLYVVNMSTITGSSAGGFEVGASTTLPSVEGVVRNARTLAPLEAARVRVWNSTEPCASGNCDYNVYETLTDVNGKYSFYNVVSTAAAYSLSAQKAGYNRGLYGEISVSTSATVYREFQLQEATYTLRGVIRYRDVPVPNADVMVVGDYGWYAGSDSYRNGKGMTADGRARTAADGSFLFSPATLNGLPDGQLRMSVAFFGKWLDLNEGNYQDLTAIDADDARIVISSAGAAGLPNSGCTAGRNWKLAAAGGACQGYGDINFNIMPQKQNDYATLSGSVTFVTTYTVSAVNPLVISTMAPVTVMALQECSGVCADRSMGFAVLSGTYTVNVATYSIKLSTGMAYYTRVTASEWAEVSAFDDRADFKSTSTLSLTMNFVVTKAGSLKGVVKMPDGSSYKPAANLPEEQAHSLDILLRGQNVDVNEAWSVDDYGAFEFPNLAPGLYTVTMKPNGLGFRWAAPAVSNVAVVPGKVTQVTLKLADGLVVQPQVSGSSLPVISTPAWTYRMVPVESGVAMSQKKLTELLFGEDAFAFSYSTTTQTWDPKVMLTGKYDFYLTMGARYAPDADPASYDHFAAFITKVRGFSVQRSTSAAGLGTDAQPLPVSVSGAPGTELLAGTMLGERIYSDADLDRVFSNFSEIYSVSPAVMVYDAAGDLRGYSAGLPGGAQLADFEAALQTKDKALVRAYFAAHPGRFMVSGLAAGRYTAVFSNPNYPPVTKEITLPLDLSYNGSYPFNFDEQTVRTGDIYGTVKSTVTGSGLDNAVVYLKHRTVERFTTTAGDGSFRFSGLPSGIYRLEVTRDGFVKAGQKTSLAGSPTGDDSARLDFYLTPSQSNMAGKVYLSKFPAPLTAAGVTVVAYDETYNTLHPSEYLAKIEATTNDDGDYELAGVVPGHNYKVTAFYAGKLPATLDVAGDAVTEGVTYLPDMVMCEVAPQIKVKVIKSPAGAGQVDVTIISPKQLVSMPVCTVNEGAVYDAANAAAVALTPGPNNTYLGRFTESLTQLYYTVYVSAGDGANTMEKTVVYSSVDQGRAEQYIQKEAIQGGNIQMDPENGDYSGIELDAGALTSSGTASGTSGYRSSAYRASASDGLVGGFFSGLPAVRTIRTAKGDLNLAQAIQDLMASEVYNMELENASVNKPFTLTLTYDKNKAPENGNLRIYQYDSATGGWLEVPGDYTLDPVLGVLSVDVAALTGAHEGTGGIETPLGRKRLGMSAIVNGRYVPSAASTTQSGRFAVFTAMPPTGVAYAGPGFVVYNMPNPFDLKSKSVTLSSDIGASGIANPYATYGTLIKYHLPAGKSGNVKFVIYNVAGEKVRTITDGVRAGGEIYYSEWDGRNDNGAKCASGVYFMLTYLDGKQLGSKAHKMAIIK